MLGTFLMALMVSALDNPRTRSESQGGPDSDLSLHGAGCCMRNVWSWVEDPTSGPTPVACRLSDLDRIPPPSLVQTSCLSQATKERGSTGLTEPGTGRETGQSCLTSDQFSA